MFRSPETPEAVAPWTFPVAPPIHNSYSANASAAVYSLAIDPINANVVYTGSSAGLAKTTDGGATWQYLSDSWDSQSVSAIAINPDASNDVYVGTGREGTGYASYQVGLYRSFDGGSTWSSPLGETDLTARTSGQLPSTRTLRARNSPQRCTSPTAAPTVAACGAQMIAAPPGRSCTRCTTAFMM